MLKEISPARKSLYFIFLVLGLLFHKVLLGLLNFGFNVPDFIYSPGLQVVFSSLIIAPIFEEIIFRLSLIPNKNYLTVTVAGIFFDFLVRKEVLVMINGLNLDVNAILIFVFITLLGFLIIKKWLDNRTLELFYKRWFKMIFYTTTIVFALSHYNQILLFDDSIDRILLLLSYLSLGFVLGYIRLKLGFFWAISTHFIYNLFAL